MVSLRSANGGGGVAEGRDVEDVEDEDCLRAGERNGRACWKRRISGRLAPGAEAHSVSSRPVSRLTGEHYRLVKQIITEEVDPPDPALQRTGLVQAVAMPDRHIAWVLESDKEKFEREGLGCLHESARSLFD